MTGADSLRATVLALGTVLAVDGTSQRPAPVGRPVHRLGA
jgi:hypothetical protein